MVHEVAGGSFDLYSGEHEATELFECPDVPVVEVGGVGGSVVADYVRDLNHHSIPCHPCPFPQGNRRVLEMLEDVACMNGMEALIFEREHVRIPPRFQVNRVLVQIEVEDIAH